MTININLTNIIITLGVSGGLIAAFTYLARVALKQLLSRDLEKFKAELQARHDAEIERLRTNLRIYEYRSARLHQKRATVIAELYGKLWRLYRDTYRFVHPFQPAGSLPETAQWQAVINGFNDFTEYFYEKAALYLDKPLREKVSVFNELLSKVIHERAFSVEYGKDRNVAEQALDAWKKAFEKMETEVTPILSGIEEQFRKLLGVENRDS